MPVIPVEELLLVMERLVYRTLFLRLELVSSIVVSLSAVPDAPTSLLMTEFYHILQTQPDKAQALRQAMLNTIKKHPVPQDWAAFTLIGEALSTNYPRNRYPNFSIIRRFKSN